MSLVIVKSFDPMTASGLIRGFNSFFNYTPYYQVLTPHGNKRVDILVPISGFFKRHIYARWI